MSQEVKIILWCDNDHEEPALAVITRTVTIDEFGPTKIDLCDTCDKIIEMAEELAKKGVPATRVKPLMAADKYRDQRAARGGKPRPWGPCEICGHSSTTRGGLVQHIRVHHDMTKTQYEAAGHGPIPMELPPAQRKEVKA